MELMKVVLQRVKEAHVEIDGKITGKIGKGVLLLVGFEKGEEPPLQKFAEKIVNLRIFEDENGKMNLSLKELGYEILVVPNFTLAGDVRKGRRPSFDRAMEPESARQYFEKFVQILKGYGVKVERGEFGAHMMVYLINDGPVTFIVENL